MTVDRRGWDPFAPHPRRTPEPIDVDGILASLDPALADPGDDPWGGANLEPAAAALIPPRLTGLDAMRKPDLVALAEQHGLDTTGTRPELIARLREATP